MPMNPGQSVDDLAPAKTYSPAQLARATGISADALRFYERNGLLPRAPRSASGRRIFPPSALQRVRVIRAALSLGFTVAELSRIFRLRDAGAAPCQAVCELATAKLAEMEQALAQLTATRDVLAQSLRVWRRKLRSAPHGARVGLLDLFAAAYPARTQQLSPRLAPGRGGEQGSEAPREGGEGAVWATR